MAGKVILIVGARGTGKSTLVKSKLEKVNKKSILLYDPNGEYKEIYPYELVSFDEFTQKATKVREAVIVIEEATINLGNRGNDKNVIDFLVKSRHKGNTVFLVYHSLRAVPVYIYDMADFLYLKKTNDSLNRIDQKFDSEELSAIFTEVNKHPDKYYSKLHSIY